MSMDKATVARVAMLARIKVPEEQLEGLAGELAQILTFVEQLGEVSTDGVEPMTGVGGFPLPRRDDVVTDGGYPAKVVANAPDGVGNFFAVPKVVE